MLPSLFPLPHPVSRTRQILPVYYSTIEHYLAAIKVYDLTYQRHRNSDGDCNVTARFRIGSYDPSGAFHWRRASADAAPPWVFNASYTYCSGARFRGVGLEWRDFEGSKGTKVVRY